MNSNIRIDLKKSHDSYVFDKNTQREILDFHSHYSSLTLGYNHNIFDSHQFKDEILMNSKIKISFCAYESEEKNEFDIEFRKFVVPKYFNFVHYCSTGSLAVETACKVAMHYHNYTRTKILSIKNSFHGINSFGNFLTTSSRLDGIPKHASLTFDTIENYLKLYTEEDFENVSAIVIEPIQCTSGDVYLPNEQLKQIRELCTKYNIVLIYDEIQTGLSTGKTFYFQYSDITPDIIVFGKKFQVSGIIVREGFDSIKEDIMRLSVTFDSSVVDMTRSKYILREIYHNGLLEKSIVTGDSLRLGLSAVPQLKNVRGIGGLIAFDFDNKEQRDYFYKTAFKNGLMANPTGEKTIRLRPSLAITYDEVLKAVQIITNSVK